MYKLEFRTKRRLWKEISMLANSKKRIKKTTHLYTLLKLIREERRKRKRARSIGSDQKESQMSAKFKIAKNLNGITEDWLKIIQKLWAQKKEIWTWGRTILKMVLMKWCWGAQRWRWKLIQFIRLESKSTIQITLDHVHFHQLEFEIQVA